MKTYRLFRLNGMEWVEVLVDTNKAIVTRVAVEYLFNGECIKVTTE